MADRARSHLENAPGAFFVDATCIDCDTCRQVAPLTFAEADGHSYVRVQPADEEAVRAAARALLCCPTNSIGSERHAEVKRAVNDFPLEIAPGVFHCGFNAESSFGGHSYFIQRPDGNWLVDSPRWVPQLVSAFTRMGGVSGIFLTHRDDVADAARYARHFAARRVIHAGDADAVPDAEEIWEGLQPRAMAADLLAIPTPGHTAGHALLLHRDAFLFTGDHLWWSRNRGMLNASRAVCWHSWSEQTRSMRGLLEQRFSWVLPGHGERAQLDSTRMHQELAALVERMEHDSTGE